MMAHRREQILSLLQELNTGKNAKEKTKATN